MKIKLFYLLKNTRKLFTRFMASRSFYGKIKICFYIDIYNMLSVNKDLSLRWDINKMSIYIYIFYLSNSPPTTMAQPWAVSYIFFFFPRSFSPGRFWFIHRYYISVLYTQTDIYIPYKRWTVLNYTCGDVSTS